MLKLLQVDYVQSHYNSIMHRYMILENCNPLYQNHLQRNMMDEYDYKKSIRSYIEYFNIWYMTNKTALNK